MSIPTVTLESDQQPITLINPNAPVKKPRKLNCATLTKIQKYYNNISNFMNSQCMENMNPFLLSEFKVL